MQTVALAALLLLTVSCTFSANAAKWEKYFFNGQEFQVGGADNSPAIWIRNGYAPRGEEPRDASLDYGRLHPKTGAVAGACIVQTSSGNPAGQGVVRPLPDEQITLKSLAYGISVTRSDHNGFFIEELLPEEYQLFCRQTAVKVRVRQGRTALVPIIGE